MRAFGGAAAVRFVRPEYLRLAFGLIMLYIAVRFLVESNSETANVAAGLTAAGLGLVGYWGLRASAAGVAWRVRLTMTSG